MAQETLPNESKSGKLDSIALSLSGGGVRAVGFHLGLLDMLDRLDLLTKVKILSTVSGGSLTGTGYAMAQKLGHSYDSFFRNFYEFLPNLNTLEHLLSGLSGPDAPAPSGRRDMITVMANIYDNEFFSKFFAQPDEGSPRFKTLLDGDGGHLEEIVFNATEFQTGTAFRFQKSRSNCLVGNGNIFLCHRHTREIRMADIMAASSCIPAGMEPLFFPDDFHWPSNKPEMCEEIRSALDQNLRKSFRLFTDKRLNYIALMDGGVYDNQGIVGLILAMNRLKDPQPVIVSDQCDCGSSIYESNQQPGPDAWARWFAGQSTQGEDQDERLLDDHSADVIDVIIISDTPVRKDSQYPKIGQSAARVEPIPAYHPGRKEKWIDRLTVGGLDRFGWFLTALLLTSASLTFYQEIWPNRDWSSTNLATIIDDLIQVGIPLALTIGLAIVLLRIRRHLRRIARDCYHLIPKRRWKSKTPWAHIKGIRIRDLIDMVKLRVGSVSALTASIFMNRIRALSYSAAYTRKNVSSHIIANQIFALEPTQQDGTIEWPQGMEGMASELSADAAAIVLLAAHMPTKLWINQIRSLEESDASDPQYSSPLKKATDTVVKLNVTRAEQGLRPLNDLDVLVICGQLTICFKLLTHLWQRDFSSSDEWSSPESQQLFEAALHEWEELVRSPTTLLDRRKDACGISKVATT